MSGRTMAAALLLAGMALPGAAAFAKGKVVQIDLSVAADDSCQAQIGGTRLAVTDEELQAKLPALLPDKDAHLRFGSNSYENIPYRCIGPLISNLQRLGYRYISFMAEPPPLGLEITNPTNHDQ